MNVYMSTYVHIFTYVYRYVFVYKKYVFGEKYMLGVPFYGSKVSIINRGMELVNLFGILRRRRNDEEN